MRIKRILAVGVALVSGMGLAACADSASTEAKPDAITIAVSAFELDVSWDPRQGGYGLYFMGRRPAYDALITWDTEAKEYSPWLAEDFSISDDGKQMSITLRDDVTFSDGTKMDAEAVAKSQNALWTTEGSYWATYPENQRPIFTATGDYTIEVTTGTPLYEESPIMLELTYVPIINPKAIDDPSLLEDDPNGTGPYLLDKITPEVSATFERNPDYWNPEAFPFDSLTVMGMDDKVAALNAMKSGEVDAAQLDPTLAKEAQGAGLTINTGPGQFFGLAFIDRTGEFNPPLGDVRVRQAINYAIDREAIAETLDQGYGNPSSQPFDPNSNEYVEGGDDRYAYDPDKARALLAEAGYADGFTITIPRQPPPVEAVDYRPVVEQDLADVGIEIDWVKVAQDVDLTDRIKSGEFDATYVASIFSNNVRTFDGGTDGWTYQPIEDPAFKDLIAQYTGTRAQHEASQDPLTEYILEQAYYAPIAQPQAIWATADGIEMTVTNTPTFFPTVEQFQLGD